MRLDHLLSKENIKLKKLESSGRSSGHAALSSFEGITPSIMYTENYTEEMKCIKIIESHDSVNRMV